MSDRAPVQLTVHGCPLNQTAAVLSVIEEHGLHLEDVEDGQPAENQLGLGLTYMDLEIVCGSARIIAQQLEQSAPGASWEIWEKPKYEWLGNLYRFTPDLGLWTANCDPEGTPVFTPNEVHRLAVLPNTVDEPARARALGETHDSALCTLAARNEDVVLDPYRSVVMSAHANPDAQIYANFLKNTEKHVLKVIHDDGLYRHLRYQEPGTRMRSMDITTWPGHLATSGDIGEGLIFAGETDMIDFFASAGRVNTFYSGGAPSIDFRYWAEKVQGRDLVNVKRYDRDLFLRQVRERLEENVDLGTDAQIEYEKIVDVAQSLCSHHGIDFAQYAAETRRFDGDTSFDIEIDDDDADQIEYFGRIINERSPDERREEILENARWHANSNAEAHTWLSSNEAYVGSDTWEWELCCFDQLFLIACYCINAAVRLYCEQIVAPDDTDED